MTLNYTKNGDYLIPNLTLSQPQKLPPLGKYGKMRKTYLAENRPIFYNRLILSQKLYPHLAEIDRQSSERVEFLMSQYLTNDPPPDKATNQMAWVRHMNTLKAQAEEVVMTELIYS